MARGPAEGIGGCGAAPAGDAWSIPVKPRKVQQWYWRTMHPSAAVGDVHQSRFRWPEAMSSQLPAAGTQVLKTDHWLYGLFQSAPDLITLLLPAAGATPGSGPNVPSLGPDAPGDAPYRFDGVLWPRSGKIGIPRCCIWRFSLGCPNGASNSAQPSCRSSCRPSSMAWFGSAWTSSASRPS